MSKGELKQEAEESAEKFFGKPTDLVDLDNLRIFKNGYLASAEPREKRIEELEKENRQLKNELEDLRAYCNQIGKVKTDVLKAFENIVAR